MDNLTVLTFDYAGDGSPENVVRAPIGSIYRDLSSARIFRKTTGSSRKTGWVEDNGEGIGTMKPWGGVGALPTGWLFCFGQAVSRTTYSALFAVIGTVFGVGDGSTTFNIPDLRGRTLAGRDDMGGVAANRLTVAVFDGTILGNAGGQEVGNSASVDSVGGGSTTTVTTHSVQPTIIVNYIIKTGV